MKAPIVFLIIIICTTVSIYIKCNICNLKVFFIDVGQGDSTLIITPNNKKILIDGGGNEFGGFDVGEKTLLPYLLARQVKSIDYIIISHFDSDHCQRFIYYCGKVKS
ncbi:MAG: MBL fold metallo-hydrolase [Clostridia bacterium]|nr:MBL fold metallo-hydrolase [Clostridia bacterium]